MSRLLGLVLAAEIGLAGCAAAPNTDHIPQPMPMPGATQSPGPEVTKPCAGILDPDKLQVIANDRQGVLTARYVGPECVPVYKARTQTRIGNLAAGGIFAALCHGALPGEGESWFIHYGPGYEESGAIYVAANAKLPEERTSKEKAPVWGCDMPPYLGDVIGE